MYKALLYKEWLKTRRVIAGLLSISLALLLYQFISLRRIFRILGMNDIWDTIVNRHQMLYDEWKYLLLLFGLLPALAQFIPEMQKKRLKLTLHLPVSQTKAYLTMQLYGLGVILLTFFLQMLMLLIFSSIYFPKEIISTVFISLLPWYCAGICTYLFTASICLEPSIKRRIIYTSIALGTIYFFYLSGFPGAYTKVWWMYLLIPILIFMTPLLSISRFKKGIQ